MCRLPTRGLAAGRAAQAGQSLGKRDVTVEVVGPVAPRALEALALDEAGYAPRDAVPLDGRRGEGLRQIQTRRQLEGDQPARLRGGFPPGADEFERLFFDDRHGHVSAVSSAELLPRARNAGTNETEINPGLRDELFSYKEIAGSRPDFAGNLFPHSTWRDIRKHSYNPRMHIVPALSFAYTFPSQPSSVGLSGPEVRPRRPAVGNREERSIEICECLIDVAAALFNVSGRDIRAPGRTALRIARVRQIAMYVAHVTLQLSMTDIGRAFGRDRTTVQHACHIVEDLRDDDEFDRLVTVTERIAAASLRARMPGRCHEG